MDQIVRVYWKTQTQEYLFMGLYESQSKQQKAGRGKSIKAKGRWSNLKQQNSSPRVQNTQQTRKARGEHSTRKQVRNADETKRERGENTGFNTKERLIKKHK